MAFTIEIISVEKIKDKYEFVEVEYNYKDKVNTTKLANFGKYKGLATQMLAAVSGECYEVEVEKNDKGYTTWCKVTKKDSNVSTSNVSGVDGGYKGRSTSNDSYSSGRETPEERAKRQLYIVRQSSLSTAERIIASQQRAFGVDEVVNIADELVKWVMSDPAQSLQDDA